MNNNASKMIMDCVSSICRTVEAAMINKTICQILNSMGPARVTHQIQLNKRNNCLPAKSKVAVSQCSAFICTGDSCSGHPVKGLSIFGGEL